VAILLALLGVVLARIAVAVAVHALDIVLEARRAAPLPPP
jgi:hypothetical protein